MTTPIPLAEAVQRAIFAKVLLSVPFSAFDITQTLRRSKSLLEKTPFHSEVRPIVHNAVKDVGLDSFSVAIKMAPNGTNYTEYTFVGDAEIMESTATAPMVPASKFVQPSQVWRKIRNYLIDNASGRYVTLKAVQSRLKRQGSFTCTRIAELIRENADKDPLTKNKLIVMFDINGRESLTQVRYIG